MNGYPTKILNDFLNVSSTIYYQGSPVTDSNPLPCSLGDGTVNITGDVYIPAVISVYSTTSNPVHTHVVESIPIELAKGSNTIGNVNINGIVPISFSNAIIPTYLTQQLPTGSNTIGNVYINIDNSKVTNRNPFPVRNSDDTLDAFGRLRISEPFTLGDYKHIYGIDPTFQDITSNGGAVTFVKDKACCTLTTSTASNSLVIHQTKRYHQYLPGKSQLVLSSINFKGFTSNVTKRTGYYDNQDGIYFELNGSNEVSFNIRSFVGSGSFTSNERVLQNNWNIDTFNDPVNSAFVLDLTTVQLVAIDFQWLGVGRVRCGFSHNGLFYPAHEFNHTNIIKTVYMSNPTLPVRCEIFNTGPTTGGSMDQICSTVLSEGGYVEVGYDFSVTSDIRTITAGLGNALPILCIALRPTYKDYINRMIVRLSNTSVFSVNENVAYRILKLPSISNVVGGSWANVNTDNSGAQYNKTATSISTLGIEMGNGFVAASQQNQNFITGSSSSDRTGSTTRSNFIVQNIQGNDSEVYVIYVTTLTANSTQVAAGVQWREIF